MKKRSKNIKSKSKSESNSESNSESESKCPDECPICLGPLKYKAGTKCNHIFCDMCIVHHLIIKNTCPICRGVCNSNDILDQVKPSRKKIIIKNVILPFLSEDPQNNRQLEVAVEQPEAEAEPEIQANRPITNQRSYFAEIFLHIKVICLIIFNIYIWSHLFQIFCKSVHDKYAI
jgi:hypothetical protein